MLGIEHDAMLVIVDIRGILQAPIRAANLNGNHTMVLTGRMIHPACITFIFGAQQALGIRSLGRILSCGNGLGILFRLRKVDGNIQLTVFGCILPAHILGNTVATDIIGITAELVVPVGGLHRIFCVLFTERADHFPGHRGQSTHNLCIKQVLSGDVVIAQTLFHSVVQDARQNLFQVLRLGFVRRLIVGLTQQIN